MSINRIRLLTYCAVLSAAMIASNAMALVNGADDFSHPAVGAILVHEPGSPRGDWVADCSGILIHPRVLLTAGHCVQGISQKLDAGVYLDARVSFQQAPLEHGTFDPGDPEANGWLAIDELVNNPDNPDWLNFFEIAENWGMWHDQGAVILAKPVKHIRPLRVPRRPGQVGRLMKIRCELLAHIPQFCQPLLVGYGLTGFPPSGEPQRRRSLVTGYQGIVPLFITTQKIPGDACFGDSGGAVIMKMGRWGRDLAVALMSSPLGPFPPFCTDGSLQYRLDTESSIRFIWGVLFHVEFGRRHRGPLHNETNRADTDS